jgi:hypothetical protein
MSMNFRSAAGLAGTLRLGEAPVSPGREGRELRSSYLAETRREQVHR